MGAHAHHAKRHIVERGETRPGVKRATLAFTGMRNYNETIVTTAGKQNLNFVILAKMMTFSMKCGCII